MTQTPVAHPEPTALPEKVRALAEAKSFPTVVTLLPDGTPQARITWIDTDGDYLLVNTERDRQRAKNVRRDPRVTVLLVDPANPYSQVEVRGHVAEIVEDASARAHIDKLAQKYTGADYANPIGSPRVILKVAADRIV
jgi:PPOX class probable F420-dependent enzyme